MDETRRVGRYVLLERVGAGRHGTVHRARDVERVGRVVAVKLLDDPATSASLAAFRGMMERAAALGHPAVLPADVVVDGGRDVALVRPYVPGGSIAEAVATAVRPARLLAIGAEAAGALAALHAAGVVHGGLTADDLLLASGDRPRLADVGLATLVGEDLGSPREDVQALARVLRGAVDPHVPLPADAVTALDTAAAGLLTAAELQDALAAVEVPDPAAVVPGPDLEAVLSDPPPTRRRRRPGRTLLVFALVAGVAAVVTRPWLLGVEPAPIAPAAVTPTVGATPRSSQPSPPAATTTAWQERRAPRVCDDAARPPDATAAQVVVADLDGRGCGLPLVLSDDAAGRQVVSLPAEAGALAGRWAVARAGEQVLLGDWDGDGSETPAVVTNDGVVFLYDRFGRVTARRAGVTLPPGRAATVVTDGTRDRITCATGSRGGAGPAGPCTEP